MKYYLIGEDISKIEIPETEAKSFVQEDDYRVTCSSGYNAQEAQEQGQEPGWVPFEFPEKPGYTLSGFRIVRIDASGEFNPHEVDSVPPDAVKAITPNTWHRVYQSGYDIYTAYPVYDVIQTEACGGCSGCARLSCKRRADGVRCKNYKEVK